MKRAIILYSMFCVLCSVSKAADEINAFSPGITNAYSVVREVDGDVWYVSGQVFESWGTAARTAADYDIALVDKSGGMFVGDFDTNISAGQYHIITHYRVGGSPADTDPAIWQEYGDWDGSSWQPYTQKTIEDKIDALNDLSAAQVNAEVDTALSDYDPPTKAEMDAGFAAVWATAMVDIPAGAPSATCSVLIAINYIYESWRNKTETIANEISVYRDDGSTKLVESDTNYNGVTFTKGEYRAED
jgi:hypothetical protein